VRLARKRPRSISSSRSAEQIVYRREVLLRTLRQQRALTLEIEPAHLSAAVVNHYLLAKERALI
jgi:hypothetical protein